MFFSVAHRTFSKIGHILGHKTSPSKYKKTEIISCTLSDYNPIKLGRIQPKKKQQKILKQLEAEQHITQ
jgi:hypothetical protein